MTEFYEIIQGTFEWFEKRKGKFGASKAADLLMSPSKVGYNNLINTIVYMRITNEYPESFSNEWTDRGTELEPEAIRSYELLTFNKIKSIGYVEIDDFVGCSPDGMEGDTGLIQVKCPKYTTHIDYIIKDKVPSQYYKQMQYEMMVTEREYNIFFSYHPNLRPFMKKIYRDESMINEIKEKLKVSIELVKKRIEIIMNGNSKKEPIKQIEDTKKNNLII